MANPNIKRKKILIIGASIMECFIVKRAQELGIYAIVTDNYEDRRLSPAKEIADESWDISWTNIDELAEKCKNEKIDGVIAGFSEFRIESQIKLSEKLGTPCYITERQLSVTRDKLQFKDVCKKSGLQVVPEFSEKEAEVNLPVIIKPVDRGGSIGISVAHDVDELQDGIKKAYEASPSKTIVIEKFMGHMNKYDVYYMIQNGDVSLIGSSDTMMCDNKYGREFYQAGWYFPSVYEKVFEEKCGKEIRNLLKNLDVKDGYITISAFVDQNQDFYIFETGLRLSGELSFLYTEHAYGINFLDYLLNYAVNLEVAPKDFSKRSNNNKFMVANVFSESGKIISRTGLSQRGEGYVTYDFLGSFDEVDGSHGKDLSTVAISFITGNSDYDIAAKIDLISDKICLESDRRSLIYDKIDSKKFIAFCEERGHIKK